MTLAAWLHSLSPFIVRFTDDFGIRWYGVAYLAGFVVAYALLMVLARRRLVAIPFERVPDAMMWLIGGVLIGGRLGYVLVYDQQAAITFTRSVPFWGLLAIHHGGMASHGGMVGVAVAAWRVSRGWPDASGAIVGRCPPLHIMDVCTLISPLGLFFGRLANFVNGELLGRIVTPPGTPGPWWTVQYPQELREWSAAFLTGQAPSKSAPTLDADQLATLADLRKTVIAEGVDPRHAMSYIIEHARLFAPELKQILTSRHPSQLYQAVAEGLVLGAALWLLWYKPRRPGFIGGWFLIIYGVLRILTEYWRLPDSQFEDGRPWGLSRGQWLSAAMIGVGLAVLYYVKRRNAPRMGGWGTRPLPPSTPKHLDTPTPSP